MLAITAVINAKSVVCSPRAREPSDLTPLDIMLHHLSVAITATERLGRLRRCPASLINHDQSTCRVGARTVSANSQRSRGCLSAVVRSFAMLFIFLASPLHAQTQLIDPNLPTVKPHTLQHLSDNRVRQRVMQESQARFGARCVCPYQTNDLNGRSCRGRHEVITTPPRPICYPSQVTKEMVNEWRQRHQ